MCLDYLCKYGLCWTPLILLGVWSLVCIRRKVPMQPTLIKTSGLSRAPLHRNITPHWCIFMAGGSVCSVWPRMVGRDNQETTYGFLQTLPVLFSYDQTVYPYYITVINLSQENNYMTSPMGSSRESLTIDIKDPDTNPGQVALLVRNPTHFSKELCQFIRYQQWHDFSKAIEYIYLSVNFSEFSAIWKTRSREDS